MDDILEYTDIQERTMSWAALGNEVELDVH